MEQILKHWRKIQTFALTSEGDSMMPILQPDDVVYYKKVLIKDCYINDLVLVKKEGEFFTHRVIYKKRNFLITKGDNNLESDGKIKGPWIFGKVISVKRRKLVFDPNNFYDVQSTLYFQEIIKIKKKLVAKKADFIFLKGLPLHLLYERSYPRRNYFDCDVLISLRDSDSIELILRDCGYTKVTDGLSHVHSSLKDKETETVFFKVIQGIPVVFDVHYEAVFMMTQLGKLDMLYPQHLVEILTKMLLKKKRHVRILGESFSILSQENLIIYLSLHFFHHNFKGVQMLAFLDKVIRSKAGNNPWRNIVGKILSYKLQNFVYPVFVFLRRYYKTPIPIYYLNKMKSSSLFVRHRIKDTARVDIFSGESRIAAGVHRFCNLLFYSPEPLFKRLLIFMNLQVIYSVLWLIYRKASDIIYKHEKRGS